MHQIMQPLQFNISSENDGIGRLMIFPLGAILPIFSG